MRNNQKAVRSGYLFFVLFVFLCACVQSRSSTSTTETPIHKLVVLHTNDTHGHAVRFTYQGVPDVGGLPARATLVNQIRKEDQNVLLLDAGDINTGTAVSDLFKAKPDLVGFNYIGYDAMVIGNHEFDNPLDVLREQIKEAQFPFLSANVMTNEGAYIAQPYVIKAFPGFKAAILGLTTKATEAIGHPANVRNLVFRDEVEVARKLVPKLKKEADVVIALVHMGIFPSSLKGSRRLALQVRGIDLIVDGHSHTKLESPIVVKHGASDHETLIVQAWKWGLVLGRVDLQIQNKEIIDVKFDAIPVNLDRAVKQPGVPGSPKLVNNEIEEDPKLLALLQPYVDQIDRRLSKTVGYAEGTFYHDEARHRETLLGRRIANAMVWFTRNLGVDFAIQNGGGIRADLPAGPITMKQIYEILPFNNSIVVVTLKGSDVQSLCDYMASISAGQGAFPQLSEGVSLVTSGTGGCENVLINGRLLDPKRLYKVATNSYLAAGGDGYKILLKAVQKHDTTVSQRLVFVDYIKHLGGTISPETGERSEAVFNEPFRKAA